jgi:hypothetical protein
MGCIEKENWHCCVAIHSSMAVNFGQLILYADHFRPEKPGAANQMRKEQCWIYAGVDSNRGGGSPVRQAPDIASGMGWKKDGF